MAERAHCMYCHDELWSHLERNGVCCSCQGRPLDEAGDLESMTTEELFSEGDG